MALACAYPLLALIAMPSTEAIQATHAEALGQIRYSQRLFHRRIWKMSVRNSNENSPPVAS